MLLVNVLVVAICALVYELLCGTLASYLLGDAVLQFSLVLGTYLFAMGVGAWAVQEPRATARPRGTCRRSSRSRWSAASPCRFSSRASRRTCRFVRRSTRSSSSWARSSGVELPLLVKILREPPGETGSSETPPDAPDAPKAQTFGELVARALAYDYVGALAASLLFPLVLVPRLGLVRTSVVTGAVNAVVALSATFVVRVERPKLVRVLGLFILAALAVTFVRGEAWVSAATD